MEKEVKKESHVLNQVKDVGGRQAGGGHSHGVTGWARGQRGQEFPGGDAVVQRVFRHVFGSREKVEVGDGGDDLVCQELWVKVVARAVRGANVGDVGTLGREPVLHLIDCGMVDRFVKRGSHGMSQLASNETGKGEVIGAPRDSRGGC